MHTTMRRLRDAAPRRTAAAAPGAWPIALLAATLLQLRTDDLLITAGPLPLADTALQSGGEASFHPNLLPFSLACSHESAAAVAAGHALAQSRASRPGDHAPLTVAMIGMRTPHVDALQLAGKHMLPLLLVMRDEPGRPRPNLTAPDNVEIVPVDAEDAIAVCRVVQESMLRARNRWGAVVLRAITLPGSNDPVAAIEAHLERRGVKPALAQAETR
ncbi:MAG: hypothetical protein INR71_09265 [Terriglobus roseus]|nr:hypothetical protein [Terriglobus roseus]